ncbi:MAG: hypothetical protein ABFE01_08975, partial [Phycisphaerales bacterium]
MKRHLLFCCFTLVMCSLSLARDYYVAVDGSDVNPGTIDKPFATLEKTRDTIRESKARVLGDGGLSVYLRQGKYFRTLPFVLETKDSGESGKPIVYRAYPGENVRLIGGVQIAAAWFAPVAPPDAEFARLEPAARGKCLKADLAAHGIASVLGPLQAELSFNGVLMPVARWPN